MTMLRRRGRKPKPGERSRFPGAKAAGAANAASLEAKSSRRRPREGAVVPPELVIKPAARAEVVLVTGFEPFGGEKSNPSWEVCARLPSEIAGLRVVTCRIPCEFRRAIEVVAAAIEQHQPVLVVCLGQAGGRAHLSVERVAINVDDARIPDNAGARPIDEPIALSGPPAYFATLPVKAMAAAMRAAGVPAQVSNTAGTYVCNHLMYGVLHYLAASGRHARAGFIHVPYSEEQVLDKTATPAMSVATMARGIEAAIAAARRHRRDIRSAEGALD
jgi:pyroglutamyl-peptidase